MTAIKKYVAEFIGTFVLVLFACGTAMVTGCATDSFAVSFVTDGTWTAPTGRTRIYRNDVTNPAELSLAVEESAVADPVIGLVFITNNVDVRFDAYSVLRPINLAH